MSNPILYLTGLFSHWFTLLFLCSQYIMYSLSTWLGIAWLRLAISLLPIPIATGMSCWEMLVVILCMAYMNPSAGTLFQFLCAGLKALSIKNLTSGEMKARNSAFLFDGKNFHV